MTQLLIPNPHACGIGLGAECCAYLIAGREGFMCGRVTDLVWQLRARAQAGEMNARRTPTAPYPDCQLKEEA
jgi:hypothetical protein